MSEGLLVNPMDSALTSCIGTNTLTVIDNKRFNEIIDNLRGLDEVDLNKLIENNLIIVAGKVDIEDSTDSSYTINSMWNINRYRCGVKHYCYLITPTDIKATNIYINVMKFFAWKHGLDGIDFDLWVRYKHATKIFYLEELATIIKNPKAFDAMLNYNPLFTKQEYQDWVKHYEWNYPTMVFPYRKFINSHVKYIKRRKDYIGEEAKRV